VDESPQEALDRARIRIEWASDRFVADLARLRSELKSEREPLLRSVEEHARQAVQTAITAQLDPALHHAEASLRATGATMERDAYARIAEAARTAQFRIEAADRAQERELRVRAATERAEREVAERIRTAEERLLDLLDEAAALERSLR
jgi:predicted ribosome quality control (RQC) complex YloA/Tae2 family protein